MDAAVLLQLPSGAAAPRFSPDGDRLSYQEAGEIWVRAVEGDDPPRSLGPGRAPRWLPDGAIVYLRATGGPPRFWRQPADSAAPAAPLSPEGAAVREFAPSPDGRTLALLDAPTPVTEHAPPATLWLIDAADGSAARRHEFPVGEFPSGLCWSPDGERLAWDVGRILDDRRETLHEVQFLAIAGGRPRRVVPTGACQSRFPAWRPDGRALAIAATPHPYGYYALFGLATWNADGGIARYLARDPLLVHGAAWAPDGRTIYVTARRTGITDHLYAVAVPGGEVRQLTHGLAHHGPSVVSPDGRWLACAVEEPDRLPEVWLVAADGSAARPISAANARLASVEGLHRLAAEIVRWRSVDGLALEGLLLYPPDYGPANPPSEPLPTIVDPHGGPVRVDPPRTLGDHPLHFTGLHALAERGYLCFSPDFRHSGNYGWASLQRIIDTGESVGLDFADVATGVDHLITRGLADPARLGLRGFSYGAYLVNWLVTQTGRFRAAVSADGMTDATVMPFPNTIIETRFGGNQEEAPERYRRASPLTYAAQARTPILLFEAGASLFARYDQGPRFRDALTAAGVAVEYVSYPGEPHMFFRPEHQADYLRRTLAWFDRHLR